MSRKRAILPDDDPYADVTEPAASPKRGGRKPGPSAPKDQRRASDALLIRVADDLLERVRHAAAALNVTATDIARHGLRAEVERLEREHNRGKPFPRPRPGVYETRE